METQANPNVIKKIQKLMNMADPSSGASDGEISNAMKMMNSLMKRYNLDMSQVESQTEEINIEEGQAAHLRYWSQWEQTLMSVMKYLCDVEPVVHFARNRNPKATQKEMKVCFVGTKHDVQLATQLYVIFRKQIARGGRKYKRWADSRSYCEGYVREIFLKAKQMKAERNNSSTAMVFVGRKTQALNEYTKRNFKSHRPKRSTGQMTDSYHDGRRDGSKADLGTTRRLT